MRLTTVIMAGAGAAFAVTYLVARPDEPQPERPGLGLTLVDIQQRREARQAVEAVREPVVSPEKVSLSVAPQEPMSRLADAKEQLNRSMVGLPFAMSDSVAANCRRYPGWPCDELTKFLELMKAEPRDVEWAPRMERFIVKSIESEERGALRIRALECRSTRCALEVASEAQAGVQRNWKERDVGLMWEGASAWADEQDDSTGLVTKVRIETWRKD